MVIKLGSKEVLSEFYQFSLGVQFPSLQIQTKQQPSPPHPPKKTQTGNASKYIALHTLTVVTILILSLFKGRCWVNMRPAISSRTFELLKNESLIRKVIILCWYSGNSSLRMSIHIKLYKQPTHTSPSNKWQARSRYNKLVYALIMT